MRKSIAALAAALLLAACTGTPKAPTVTDPAELAATGQAVIVSRGYATTPNRFAGEVDAVGQMWFSTNGSEPYDIMNPVGMAKVDKSAYQIQTVPAGVYSLRRVVNGTGRIDYGNTRAFPGFVLRPGEVVYLGDIHLRNVAGRADAQVTDQSGSARTALAAQYPALARIMKTRLVMCIFCR